MRERSINASDSYLATVCMPIAKSEWEKYPTPAAKKKKATKHSQNRDTMSIYIYIIYLCLCLNRFLMDRFG